MKKVKFHEKKTSLLPVYVTIREGKVSSSKIIEDQVVMDYDKKGRIIGVEVFEPVKVSFHR